MRRIFEYLLALPDNCGRMTYDELMVTAALVTLVITVILMISGRKTA